MRASFVIVNYNRKDEVLLTIQKTKEILKDASAEYEIIIVDNASNDGSAEAIKATQPDVILIENQINIGAPAWNRGFAKATGKYFIILDDDSHLQKGLEEAIQYLDQNENVGVLALNIKGGAFETSKWKDLSDTIGFIGCGAILRKELYEKIGGYADWIFLYTNEYEYGIRCLDAGYKIRYFEKCEVIHRTSSINRTTKRLKVFSVRNEMAIVYKFFSKEKRMLYLFRVYLNNLKGIYIFGLSSIPWYYSALIEFLKLRKTLKHTPVKKEVQDMYSKDYWSTKAFLNII
ncbi:MAG: glycosyltransferase [Segetibacter sp.]|jgi:GT2 family glycosyltransferase|nr:glycosyltransferase [Segetibacter sp.]